MARFAVTLTEVLAGAVVVFVLYVAGVQSDDSKTNAVSISVDDGRGVLVEENGRKQLTTYTGNSIALRCQVSEPATGILWNGLQHGIAYGPTVLASSDKYSVTFLPPPAGDANMVSILRIEDLTEEDAGLYTCQAVGASVDYSDDVEIVVQDVIPTETPPIEPTMTITKVEGPGNLVEAKSGEKQLRVSVDDNIILRCTVTGFISDIRWEKNRNEITGENERFQIQERTVDGDMLSSELVIRGIQADEQGRYKCWSGDTVATVKIIIRGSTQEPATCDLTCEEITDPLCHFAVYTYTGFPNLMGHTQQGHIQQYDHLVEILEKCYNRSMEFLCGILTPHCVENRGLMLPPRKMCEEFHAACDEFIVEAAETFSFDCKDLPVEENAPPRCIHFPTKPPGLEPTVPLAFKPSEAPPKCRVRGAGVSTTSWGLLTTLLVAIFSTIMVRLGQ